MKHTQLFTLSLAIGIAFSLEAQSQDSLKMSSMEIIRQGVNLHDEKKYDEAIEAFKKIDRNDSNYYLASTELLNTYLSQEKDKLGLELCDELLKLKNEYTPNILKFKADFLDDLEQYDEAEKVYQQGMKDYPVNHSFNYELAVSKIRQKQNDKAYTLILEALGKNPFHPSSHYQLAFYAFRHNNVTAAALAFQFYLLCDGRSGRAKSTVVDLEKILKLELESDSTYQMKAFASENDFTELESLIRSKVALSEKFKPKTDLTYDLTKQVQLVVENIGRYKDVKGFYNDFYGSFFAELAKNKYLETYLYYMLRGMELEKVNKWLEKNSAQVNKFEAWVNNYVSTHFAVFDENLGGVTNKVPHWYSNNNLFGAGLMSEEGVKNGYWNYYYNNGVKKAEGEFVSDKKNKTWKYYYQNGNIKEEVSYENGAEKLYKRYFDNNNLDVEVPVVKDQVDGVKKTYHSNGYLATTTEYKGGQINGKQSFFHPNGSLRYTITNVNDVISGDLVEYYDNGKKRQTAKFVEGKREGPAKKYYNNTSNSVDEEGDYLKNKPVGDWKGYYRSGKLYETKTFNKDGLLEGKRIQYYENGKVAEDEDYSNGKISGLAKYYAESGALTEEFLYKKGKLLEYRSYKKDGTKICDNKINGKNYEVTLYHPNGLKRRQGKITDGELDGVWKDYSLFGILLRETTYKEGSYDGEYKEYYHSGQLKRKRHYVNGAETGEYRSYYLNGQLGTVGQMIEGSKSGYWLSYYSDGTRKSKEYFINDEFEGWSEYFDVNGKISSENLFRELCLVKVIYHDTTGAVSQNIDLPGGTGLVEMKTIHGKTIYKRPYVKNCAEGFAESYFPDGTLESKIEYKKGKKEGEQVYYSPIGHITSKSTFFNDDRNGKEFVYSDDGVLEKESLYDDGELNGKSISYHPNGKPYRTVNYLYGDAEGDSDMQDETGELTIRRSFHKDLLLNYTYKNTKGELLPPMEVTQGTFKLNCFYANGKKSIEAEYLNGDLHGLRKVYSSNGTLIDENNYFHDWLHGTYQSFYPNGQLMEKTTYFYGDVTGVKQAYYENGKLKSEKNYKLDKEHGWSRFYDKNGKLLKSVFYYNGNPVIIE